MGLYLSKRAVLRGDAAWPGEPDRPRRHQARPTEAPIRLPNWLRQGASSGALLAALLVPTISHAQDFPSRPITLVSPAPPGGGTDTIARALAEAAAKGAGVPVIVDNRPGAFAQIATNQVAQAPADGYTLLLVAAGHTINPAVFKKLPYDTQTAFEPVVRIATSPAILVANPDLGVRSMADLRQLSREQPQRMTFASSEASIQLMTSELGMSLESPPTIVYYKGTGQSVTDVLGGHVSFAITSIASVLPYLRDGRLVAVAVTGEERSPVVPDVPTFREEGVPGMQSVVWQGILVPAGTPAKVVDYLNQRMNEALADPGVKERLRTLAYEPAGGSPAEFEAFLTEDFARQADLAAKAGIEQQ